MDVVHRTHQRSPATGCDHIYFKLTVHSPKYTSRALAADFVAGHGGLSATTAERGAHVFVHMDPCLSPFW